MTDTFNWPCITEPTGTVTLRARKAQFGDGYAQTVADGINAKVQSWPVSYTGDSSFIGPIAAFLDAHVGVSFYWTPPNGVQGYYQCATYTIVPHGSDLYTLTPTFQQVFKP